MAPVMVMEADLGGLEVAGVGMEGVDTARADEEVMEAAEVAAEGMEVGSVGLEAVADLEVEVAVAEVEVGTVGLEAAEVAQEVETARECQLQLLHGDRAASRRNGSCDGHSTSWWAGRFGQ